MSLRIGSLFSGYGGLDLGVGQVLDAAPVWHAEIASAPSAILAHNYPDVPNLGDVSEIAWDTVPAVDVLTGGFPCQDVSLAGVRRGLIPGTRSGLWSIFARAIAELRPRLVVIENVPGLLTAPAAGSASPVGSCPVCLDPSGVDALRALGAVLGSLAELRFDAEWGVFPASAVGAAHRRSRIFIVAYPADSPSLRYRIRRWDVDPAGGTVPADSPSLSGSVLGGGFRHDASGGAPLSFGPYQPAIDLWSAIMGRPAPEPLRELPNGSRALAPEFAEWLMGLPAGWISDPAIPISPAARVKAAGNGVVPRQAAAAVRLLLDRISTYQMEDA